MSCFTNPHGALYRLSMTLFVHDIAGRRSALRARRIAGNRRTATGSPAPRIPIPIDRHRPKRGGKTAA